MRAPRIIRTTLRRPVGILAGAYVPPPPPPGTPVLAFVGNPVVLAEGNNGVTAFAFTVARTGSTAGESSAKWTVTGSGGAAANAADFQATTGVVTFAAGQAERQLVVNVLGDTTLEPNEGFVITLSEPVGAVLGVPSSKPGTITNDEVGVEEPPPGGAATVSADLVSATFVGGTAANLFSVVSEAGSAPTFEGGLTEFPANTLKRTNRGARIDGVGGGQVLTLQALTPDGWTTGEGWVSPTITPLPPVGGFSPIRFSTPNVNAGRQLMPWGPAGSPEVGAVITPKIMVRPVEGEVTGASIVFDYAGQLTHVWVTDLNAANPVVETYNPGGLVFADFEARKNGDGTVEIQVTHTVAAAGLNVGATALVDGKLLDIYAGRVMAGTENVGWGSGAGAVVQGAGNLAAVAAGEAGTLIVAVDVDAFPSEILRLGNLRLLAQDETTLRATDQNGALLAECRVGLGGFEGLVLAGLAWDAGGWTIRANGGKPATVNAPTPDRTGGLRFFTDAGGWLRDVDAYPRRLTLGELKSETRLWGRQVVNAQPSWLVLPDALAGESFLTEAWSADVMRTPTKPVEGSQQSFQDYVGSYPGSAAKPWMPGYVHHRFSDYGMGMANINAEWADFRKPHPANTPPFEFVNGRIQLVARRTSSLPLAEQATVANRYVDGVDTGVRHPWVSAAMITAGVFAQRFGYFEILMKADHTPGAWPAFWLLPNDFSSESELDVTELYAHERNEITGATHWSLVVGGPQYANPQPKGFRRNIGKGWDSGWYTFGARWRPGFVDFYFNGALVFTKQTGGTFDRLPMYLLVNLAFGPGDMNPPAPEGQGPNRIQQDVEYVRALKIGTDPA